MKKSKVVLVGWDAADWKIIGPLLAEGKLPSLKSIIDQGVHGNLSTLKPPYSPMLWTSIATGKTPDLHGVLGFLEMDVASQKVRPVTSTQRKVRAIWNILHNQGYKSNLVGWWPSYPAEPINGNVITDMFPKLGGLTEKSWPLNVNAVHPQSLISEVKHLRIQPNEITGAHILPFVPKAEKIKQEDQEGLKALTKMISHDASIHAASTFLMAEKEWDFTAIYYNFVDHMCHGFMKFHPPKLPQIPQHIFDMYKDVVNGAYMFQDMMLGRTLELAGEDAFVMVLSDHGFVSDNRRMLKPPDIHAGPALEHREFGMIAIKGPGIKKKEKLYGASILDITPTLLQYMGIPVGKDMDGRVLQDIFQDPKEIKFVDSWENMPGDFAELDKSNIIEDPLSEQQAMEQLIELGYVERPDEKLEIAIKKTRCDLQFNLARVYMGKKEFSKAEIILKDLIAEPEVDVSLFMLDLTYLYVLQNNWAEARRSLNELTKKYPKTKVKTVLIEAQILMGEGKLIEAEKKLRQIEGKSPVGGQVNFQLGNLFMKLFRFDEALVCYENAIKILPDNAKFHHALAVCFLRLDRPMEAIDHVLISIELVRYFPAAHYTMGEALQKLGDEENAAKAFEMAEQLNPKMTRATIAKEKTQSNLGVDKKSYSNRPEIYIVSGLPRSGTSMMMQMLEAGGLKLLTDGVRKNDTNNPKGYMEYEKVKSLPSDNSWLAEANSQVLKVVSPLLKYLSPEFRYRVIFMQRDLDEVIMSQKVMLGREKTLPQLGLKKSFESELERSRIWENKEPGVDMLRLNYSDVIEDPTTIAHEIQKFIGIDMDVKSMSEAVESSLYRNKKST